MTKNRIAILLAATLLLLIAGCGKNAPEPGAAPQASKGATPSDTTGGTSTGATTGSGNTGTTTTPSTPQKKTYTKVNLGPLKKTETAKVGPLSVTVSEVAVTRQTTGLPAGYAYVSVMVKIANEDELYTINTTDHFRMETPQARVSKINVQAQSLRNPKLTGSLDKGASASGWLGFLVKISDGNYKFAFTHPDYGEAVWEFPL